MRSPENVLESLKSKACNQSYKYERLYRNLYNPQFYLLAYQRIQAKPGNMTAGTDGKTIDGMGMARINALIEKMRDFSYQPNPARRTYIPKANGNALLGNTVIRRQTDTGGGAAHTGEHLRANLQQPLPRFPHKQKLPYGAQICAEIFHRDKVVC